VTREPLPRIIRLLISICIGLIAWKLTVIIPQPITLDGFEIGDIGVPLLGFQHWDQEDSPYGLYHGAHEVLFQYPFTGIIALSPLLILPLPIILPFFLALSSFFLAYGILKENQLWRLLILSFPYLSAVHSVQLSILVSAALLLPFLLPIAVIKPQSSVFLVPNGKWSWITIMVSLLLVILSFILYPAWVQDWLKNGSLAGYDGWIPLISIPGVLFLCLVPLLKIPRARQLFFLGCMPQRIFYDQVTVFLLPRSWVEMLFLVCSSWIIALVSKGLGWISYFGQQDVRAHALTVIGLYLPMLVSVLLENRKEEQRILGAVYNKLRKRNPSRQDHEL
jgi:hypothetical protein